MRNTVGRAFTLIAIIVEYFVVLVVCRFLFEYARLVNPRASSVEDAVFVLTFPLIIGALEVVKIVFRRSAKTVDVGGE